ncbi:hypothetical protein TWF281_008693 [Arthrobotrys megalospora]
MTSLDTSSVRSSNEHEVAQYLRKLAAEGDVENTTQQLIDAVERGSIAPSAFKIWLSITHDPVVLKKAFEQNISVRIRKLAVEQLQKLLRSPKWRNTWDGLGAVEGFLALFRGLSASDVQDACRAISSSTKGVDSEKREAITELFKALKDQTLDKRPLDQCYQYLVAGCTKDSVVEAVDTSTEIWNDRQRELLLRNHSDILRDSLLRMVLDDDGPNSPWLFALMRDYPAAPGAVPSLSSSMEFSLEVLRKLVADEKTSKISDKAFAYEIAHPLLARCINKNVPTEILEEVVDLIAKYIDLHPSSAKALRNLEDSSIYLGPRISSSDEIRLIDRIGESWLRSPGTFERLFRLLIVKTSPAPGEVNLKELGNFTHNFEQKYRYKLLKFYVQVSTAKEDELDVGFDEGLARTTGCLEFDNIPDLDAEETLDLFLRLRKARGDSIAESCYFNSRCGIFELAKDRASSSQGPADLDLWHVCFLQRAGQQEEAEKLSRLRIAERKKAQSTPDQQLRALHSRGVLLYAIASGSLPILGEVLNWAKRLIRDPETDILSSVPDEMCQVLSGLPLLIDRDASVLRKRVEHANRIMSDLFDTVCSGLREPNFEIGHWRGVFPLFHRVISQRINRSSELQKDFSQEEIYSILWEDTLRFILDVEGKVLDNQKLQDSESSYTKHGILDFKGGNTRSLNVKTKDPSAYRFLDNLAKERDELWQKHRRSKCPEVANFAVFPQGLPLQYLLTPFSLKSTPPLEDLAPYIASRVKAIIFPSLEQSRTLIPEKGDLPTDPLGLFVESYRDALELFVPRSLPEQERREHLDSAWAYAIGPLSEGRMNAQQAIRYWKPSFKKFIDSGLKEVANELTDKKEIEEQRKPYQADLKWPENLLDIEPKLEPLKIPAVGDPTVVLEWDATPEQKEKIEEEELGKPTYIDISIDPNMRAAFARYADENYFKRLSDVKVPGRTYWHKPIWSRAGNKRAKSGYHLKEAQILSALLYIETKTLHKDRLLPVSFPSANDIRYPASYLSSECLSKLDAIEQQAAQPSGRRRRRRRRGTSQRPKTSTGLDSNTKAAIKALEAHISTVPPSLILQLAENAFFSLSSKAPEDPEFVALESLAFNLLRLLARSDRPKLALELAIRSISKYPAACFWYKPIFTVGFFRDLVPSEAARGILEFAETVSTLLEQMEKNKELKKAKKPDEKPPKGEVDPSEGETEPTTEPEPEPDADTNAETKSKSPKDEPGFVKVSTIKLLIELFEDADFLSGVSPFTSVHELCKKTSHVDIHKTVIYYLIRVIKSSESLDAEIFSILSTIADKNSEIDVHKLILELFNFSLKSSKLDKRNQSLALSVISVISEKTADVEIRKQILEYFTSVLDLPAALDKATQVTLLLTVSGISQGTLDLPLRHALVAYLLRVLKSSTSDVYDQTFDILKGLVVSCGNIDEREPVTAAQWDEFEEATRLPDCDLSGPVTESRNPILLRLTKFYKDIVKTPTLNILFTERIMIPIINEFKLQSSKYFSIFLRKYGIEKATQESFEIPPTSKTIDLISTVLQSSLGEGVVPFLGDIVSYAIFNLDPPDAIKDLNGKFKDDSKLQSLDEVKNWLASYGLDVDVLRETKLISFIRGKMNTPEEEGMSASVREQFLKLYTTVFWKETKNPDFESFDQSDILLDQLEPKPLDAAWLNHIRPVLQDIIQFADSLRTTNWEQNPDREPQILPDTFRPQLWLLTIPSQERDGDQETRCRVFAEEVAKVIDEISTSCEFISRVSSLKATLELTQNDAEDDIIVTAYLGDLAASKSSPIAVQQYTRIDVAAALLRKRNTTNSAIFKERIDDMINSWKKCGSEAVRRLGYSMKTLEVLELPLEDTPNENSKRDQRRVKMRSGRSMSGRGKKSRWAVPELKVKKKVEDSSDDDDW